MYVQLFSIFICCITLDFTLNLFKINDAHSSVGLSFSISSIQASNTMPTGGMVYLFCIAAVGGFLLGTEA